MGQIDEVQVDGVPMRIAYSVPKGDGPHPAMLVMFHRGGFDDFTQKISDDLAELGFLAAVMDLYHWPPVHEKAEDNDFPRDPQIIKDVNVSCYGQWPWFPRVISSTWVCIVNRSSILIL